MGIVDLLLYIAKQRLRNVKQRDQGHITIG